MAKDISIKLPSEWGRGGRVHLLRMLTRLRKPCFATVDTLIQPVDFLSEGFPKGYYDVCDFLIVSRGDGSVFMSVTQGQTWFVLYDGNAAAVLVGTLAWYGGAFASLPSNWLYCDGSEVAKSSYPDLATLLGTTYGTAADSVNDFVLPDFRGRHVVGGNDSETGETGSFSTRSRGNEFGVEDHTIVEAETATHAHGGDVPSTTNTCDQSGGPTIARNSLTVTGSAGGDGSHSNIQQFLALYPIIKT